MFFAEEPNRRLILNRPLVGEISPGVITTLRFFIRHASVLPLPSLDQTFHRARIKQALWSESLFLKQREKRRGVSGIERILS